METIKVFVFACLVLSLLTGSRCSISSNFGDDDDDEDDGLTIVVTNAETTSSEVVQSLTQTLMVADIASQSTEYVDDIKAPEPHSYTCDNASGIILVTTYDLDISNRVSIGDDLLLRYSNCKVDGVTANGDITISLLDAKGIDIGKFDSGTNWLYSFSAKANSFQVSTGSELFIANGEMTITVEFDATTVMLETHLASDTLSLDNGSKHILSDIDISQFINLAVVPSSYTLAIESLKFSSGTQNGTVSATTISNALSGTELLRLSEYFVDLHSPENGMLSISGKNSNADLSIMPDQLVSIDIDTDGDSISDTVVTTTWSQIQLQ